MKKKNSLGIPDSTIDEEGRKDFEEWKRKRDARKAAEAKK